MVPYFAKNASPQYQTTIAIISRTTAPTRA